MSEGEAAWCDVGFADGKTRAGDGSGDAKTFGKATSEGGFASADIANELKDFGSSYFLTYLSAKV